MKDRILSSSEENRLRQREHRSAVLEKRALRRGHT